MARPLSPMTAQIENFLRAEARGEPHSQILEQIFDLPPGSDPRAIKAAEQKMVRWRKRPDAKAIWDDEIGSRVRRRLPGALSKLESQLNDSNGWLSNKAINDLIVLAKNIGIIQTSETAVKVQIEGMPDLGSPEDDG